MTPQDPVASVLTALERALFTEYPGRVTGALPPVNWRRLIVAFSGGLDSTVLLHAMARLFANTPSGMEISRHPLLAVHVNHHLQATSDQWQNHCRAVADALGVTLVCLDARVAASANIEQAARTERYAAWGDFLQPGDLLLLAHHRDDQAETLLYRLLRGRNLSGMPVRRPLGKGDLLRPLLDLPRATLAHFAEVEHLSWVEDPTNRDIRFERNFLRHEVLPGLRERWPDVTRHLADAAGRLTEQAAQRDEWLSRRLQTLQVLPLPGTLAALDIPPLLECSEVQQLALLRHWLKIYGFHALSSPRLETLLAQLKSPADRQPSLDLAPQHTLQRYRHRLYLVYQPDVLPQPSCWNLSEPLSLAAGRLEAVVEVSQDHSVLCRGLEQLEVRWRQGGERIRPSGHAQTKSLKALFREAGVPHWQRRGYPLLFSNGDLVAVPGIAVADAFSAREGWRIRWRPGTGG